MKYKVLTWLYWIRGSWNCYTRGLHEVCITDGGEEVWCYCGLIRKTYKELAEIK